MTSVFQATPFCGSRLTSGTAMGTRTHVPQLRPPKTPPMANCARRSGSPSRIAWPRLTRPQLPQCSSASCAATLGRRWFSSTARPGRRLAVCQAATDDGNSAGGDASAAAGSPPSPDSSAASIRLPSLQPKPGQGVGGFGSLTLLSLAMCVGAALLVGSFYASSLAAGHSSAAVPLAQQITKLGVMVTAAAWLSRGFKIIGQGNEALVERLGKYNRLLAPGLHFVVPIFESLSYLCTIREQVLDVPPQRCITADNAPISADAVVYFRIYDSRLARYAVDDLVGAIQNLVLTQLRTEIGRLSLDDTFSARAELNQKLLHELDQATGFWGVKVTRMEVRDILPEASIKAALEKQMTAERTKRAEILESEGMRLAEVNKATGHADAQVLEAEASAKAVLLEAEASKQAEVLKAQGIADAISSIAEGLRISEEAARGVYLSRLALDVQEQIGSSSSSKVFFCDPESALGNISQAAAALSAAVGDVPRNQADTAR